MKFFIFKNNYEIFVLAETTQQKKHLLKRLLMKMTIAKEEE